MSRDWLTDTLDYDLYVIETQIKTKKKDHPHVLARVLALVDLLDLIDEGYVKARAAFYKARRLVEEHHGGLPAAIRGRAEKLLLMGPMHR